MTEGHRSVELAVVGGGPGGYAAAFLAADLGMPVTLIDPEENPGGVCLHRGCIPSKALLHAARLLGEIGQAEELGIRCGRPQVDIDRLREWKDEVVRKLTSGVGTLSRQRRVDRLRGKAVLRGPRRLSVRTGGGTTEVEFRHAILATGSVPSVPESLSIDSPAVWDSTRALELPEVPETLLVVGGGYIGLELGTVYAALGSRVTVVEMTPGLLPGVDRDLVSVLARRLEERFDSIRLETTVEWMETDGDGIAVVLAPKDGGQERARFERALVSVGRRPNSDGLGLETAGVELDPRGFIKVDSRRRTAQASIYAIGDLAGEPMLAHKASHEGRIAVEAIRGRPVAYEPRAVPAVVFTDPEIAWCGLTEAEAKAAGREVRVARFPWAASGRAATLGRRDGVTKLIVEPDTERILGVGIVGPGAGELISEGVLAVEMGAVVEDLAASLHPHPTLSETLMEAAQLVSGRATHYHRSQRR